MADWTSEAGPRRTDKYVLYYSDNRIKGKIWYARKAPGDGGVDWEYTDIPSKAGHFGSQHLKMWVKLHGGKCGWRFAL